MKRHIPLPLIMFFAAATAIFAFAGETDVTGSHPQVAVGPDGQAVCVFVRQNADKKSVIVRAPLSGGTLGVPVEVVNVGPYRFRDLVLALDNTSRIFAVASMPRMATRHGFTVAERDYAFQPVVTCFEVRKKSASSADGPPEYFIVSVSPNPMIDLECASRSCALLADGSNLGAASASVLILDSNGFLARSSSGKFWVIDEPTRIYTADAVAVGLARAGETYHVFYATAPPEAGAAPRAELKLHHLTSTDLESWQAASVPDMSLESGSRLCAAASGDKVALVGTRKFENGERAVVISTVGSDGTWSGPETIASGSGITVGCDAACTSDGKVHVVYEEVTQDGKTVVRYRTCPLK